MYIYLFFCIDDLPIIESGVLNSLSITVLLSIFPFRLVQSPQSCPTLCNPWTAVVSLSITITIFLSLLTLMSIGLVMTFSYLILCCPLLLLPSIFLNIRVFSKESAFSIRCPEYWSFNFSISPFNEYLGLISFRMDWFDLVFQGTL